MDIKKHHRKFLGQRARCGQTQFRAQRVLTHLHTVYGIIWVYTCIYRINLGKVTLGDTSRASKHKIALSPKSGSSTGQFRLFHFSTMMVSRTPGYTWLHRIARHEKAAGCYRSVTNALGVGEQNHPQSNLSSDQSTAHESDS